MSRTFTPGELPPDGSVPDPDVSSRVAPELDPAVLAARLKSLAGARSVASFARRCGIAESVLRSYITDHRMPPLDKALAIATTARVSLDWLATGRTAWTAAQGRAAYTTRSGDADRCEAFPGLPLEVGVLEDILKSVLEAPGARASPAQLAARVVDLYQRATATDAFP